MKREKAIKVPNLNISAQLPIGIPWYSHVFRDGKWEATPRRKRRSFMASSWRLCDPLPVTLALIALGTTNFNSLTGKPMAIGLVILLAMLLIGQVLEPCWRKQCERRKAAKA